MKVGDRIFQCDTYNGFKDVDVNTFIIVKMEYDVVYCMNLDGNCNPINRFLEVKKDKIELNCFEVENGNPLTYIPEVRFNEYKDKNVNRFLKKLENEGEKEKK